MFACILVIIFMVLGAFSKGIYGSLYFIVAALFYIAFIIDQKGERNEEKKNNSEFSEEDLKNSGKMFKESNQMSPEEIENLYDKLVEAGKVNAVSPRDFQDRYFQRETEEQAKWRKYVKILQFVKEESK